MPSARELFITRIRALEVVVDSTATLALLQQTPQDPERDAMARLFRNGLAVSAYAVLEDFLKSRTAEVFARMGASPLPFAHLPARLQTAAMEQVVYALDSQVRRSEREKLDPKPLIRAIGTALGSTNAQPYTLSALGFGHEKSNVGHADIKDILRAFNVHDPWLSASNFAARMGLGPIGLREAFQAATVRRHRGAHDAGAETPLGELENFPAEALGIAAGFDALMSRAAFRFLQGDLDFAQGEFAMTDTEVGIRYLEFDGRLYRDAREGAKRAAKAGANRDLVLGAARARAMRDGSVIIFRHGGTTRGWEPTDLTPGRP